MVGVRTVSQFHLFCVLQRVIELRCMCAIKFKCHLHERNPRNETFVEHETTTTRVSSVELGERIGIIYAITTRL